MAEAVVSDDDLPSLTKADVVAMTIDELWVELKQRGYLISGLNKIQLQVTLLQAIGEKPTTPLRTRSQAAAAGLSTAELSPSSDHDRPEAFDQLPDTVAEKSPVQHGLPSDQDPSLQLGARPKVFPEVRYQPRTTDDLSRDGTSTFWPPPFVRTTTR